MNVPAVGGATCSCGTLKVADVHGYSGLNIQWECPVCGDVLDILPLPAEGTP